MAKSSTTKGTKKRVKVKTLAAPKKKLTGKQMKKVKGGAGYIKFDGIDGEIIAKEGGAAKLGIRSK